jgi:hypothetical protein
MPNRTKLRDGSMRIRFTRYKKYSVFVEANPSNLQGLIVPAIGLILQVYHYLKQQQRGCYLFYFYG